MPRNPVIIPRLALILLLVLINSVSFSQKLYKTPSGAKYHLGSCRMVNNVSEEITAARAVELHLEPCKICHPQDVYAGSPQSSNTPRGVKEKTVQCKAITKAGTRCRHMTSLANGYCFQHNPDKLH